MASSSRSTTTTLVAVVVVDHLRDRMTETGVEDEDAGDHED